MCILDKYALNKQLKKGGGKVVESITGFLAGLGISEEMSMFIISLIPFVELRGGIVWGHAIGMDPLKVFAICFLANCLPIPFIIFLARPCFNWLKNFKVFKKLIEKIENRVEKKADEVKKNKFEMLGLMLFVGIPLPGTGAYTGSLIAALLNMRLKYAVPVIILGVFLAGLIMTLASMGLFSAIGYVL